MSAISARCESDILSSTLISERLRRRALNSRAGSICQKNALNLPEITAYSILIGTAALHLKSVPCLVRFVKDTAFCDKMASISVRNVQIMTSSIASAVWRRLTSICLNTSGCVSIFNADKNLQPIRLRNRRWQHLDHLHADP